VTVMILRRFSAQERDMCTKISVSDLLFHKQNIFVFICIRYNNSSCRSSQPYSARHIY